MMNRLERKNIEVGQKVYLFTAGFGKNFRGHYSMPLEVIRVTEKQFTVAAENLSSKPKRFMKSNGREVGAGYSRSSPSVSLATPEMQKEVRKFNQEVAAEKREKENKASAEETRIRAKYSALMVEDEAIQDRFLKPLRDLAENGEHEMNYMLKEFDGVSIENENFYRVTDAIERENRNGNFTYGVKARDYGRGFHQTLVTVVEEFETGTRYKTREAGEITDLTELLTAMVRSMLNDQMNRFFGYTFSNSSVPTEADQKFVSTLREILEEKEYGIRVEKIKEEDDA